MPTSIVSRGFRFTNVFVPDRYRCREHISRSKKQSEWCRTKQPPQQIRNAALWARYDNLTATAAGHLLSVAASDQCPTQQQHTQQQQRCDTIGVPWCHDRVWGYRLLQAYETTNTRAVRDDHRNDLPVSSNPHLLAARHGLPLQMVGLFVCFVCLSAAAQGTLFAEGLKCNLSPRGCCGSWRASGYPEVGAGQSGGYNSGLPLVCIQATLLVVHVAVLLL